MSGIVFVRTRHVYASYIDYWRLVELSEFPTCFVDEMDLSDDTTFIASPVTYIFSPMNGEFHPHVDHWRNKGCKRHAKVVHWLLERPEPHPEEFSKGIQRSLDEGYVDEVWVSDRHLLTYTSGDPRIRYVLLGSHPSLAEFPRNPDQPFGFAHFSYITGRRAPVYNKIERQGYKATPNGHGEMKSKALAGSRIMLAVRQHDNPAPIGEPLRFASAAAYSLALVSETLADPYPMVDGQHFANASYDQLADVALRLLGNDTLCREIGANLHTLLCVNNTFRSCVEAACMKIS